FAAWLMFGLAMCTKLQSIVVLPPLAVATMLRRKPLVLIGAGLLFSLVLLAMYSPFLLERRWDYFRYVFVRSFTEGRFTQINAFNFWGLGFVAPSTAKMFGLSYAQIGQLLYLGCAAWLCVVLAKRRLERASQREVMYALLVA